MLNFDEVLAALDELTPAQLHTLQARVAARLGPTSVTLTPSSSLQAVQSIMRPVYDEAASMSDAEIDAAIDEAIAEVRRDPR